MRKNELKIKRVRGFLLIVAIVVIVVIALAIAALGNMTSADIRSSSGHAQSTQAYFDATSGLEVAKREFVNGTACASLTFPGGAIPSTLVGAGTFATSGTLYPIAFTATLQANIANNSLVSQIPLSFTVGSIANLAPHGEILIDSEFITYSGSSSSSPICAPVAAPCLTGALRATNGSAIAGHSLGAVVTQQSQCVIRSVGTVQPANRVVESTVIAGTGLSNLYSGSATLISNAGTTYNLTSPSPWPAGALIGDNYVIAIVTFSDAVAGTLSTINPNNLKLVATNPGATIAQSQYAINFGSGGTPNSTAFPQETQVLLAKHTATSPPTYNVQVTPATSSATAYARVQILVINGIKAANANIVGPVLKASLNPVQNLATTPALPALPAGDNIIIAQVELNNGSAANAVRTINAGDIAIVRGTGTAPKLVSNTYPMNFMRAQGSHANTGSGYLLLALDAGAAAGTRYTVTGLETSGSVSASATLLAFNGFSAAFQPASSQAFGVAPQSLGTGATDAYTTGDRVVLAGIHYVNQSPTFTRNIAVSNESITLNGSTVSGPISKNAFNWALCSSATPECDDFFTGLLWRGTSVAATPTFGVQTNADGANMAGAANILTIKLGGGLRQINSMEIFP